MVLKENDSFQMHNHVTNNLFDEKLGSDLILSPILLKPAISEILLDCSFSYFLLSKWNFLKVILI